MIANGAALGKQELSDYRDRLPPEARLILACARSTSGPDTADEIRHLLKQPLDWPYIHRAAFRNGQIPRMWACLNQVAPEAVPADSLRSFRGYHDRHLARNRLLLELWSGLREELLRRGIPAMPYVESHFSFFFTPQSSLRGCNWMDLLVRPQDLTAARQCVRGVGGWKEGDYGILSEQDRERRGYTVFSDEGHEAALCLYWAAAPWASGVDLDAQEIWERSVEFQSGRTVIPTLSPADALLHACAQNTENMWLTLVNVADVAELLEVDHDLNWTEILGRAQRAGLRRSVLLGLSLAQDLLDARLPPVARNAVEADRGLPPLAKEVAARLLASVQPRVRTPQTLRLQLQARARTRDRLRYLWRFVRTPTVADQNLLRLPRRLHFLYGVLRPIRLAGATLRRPLERPLRALLRRPESFSGYSPSAAAVVDRMLEFGEVGKDDVLYDVGCGDGRIVIRAAQRFGTRGVGIDLDPQRIRECRENARRAEVEHLVRFLQQDGLTADVSEATVVTMYLPSKACLQVTERLLRVLRPGARIVSHSSDLQGWDKVMACEEEGAPALLYLRRVPPSGAEEERSLSAGAD